MFPPRSPFFTSHLSTRAAAIAARAEEKRGNQGALERLRMRGVPA
jgi:hypothetical protein